ncbi:DASH family cryptochrome [Spirosoma sp. KUDC1026]|uniref:DASH family cryptochrome n=1 Tax=Spirosoma sp. KUDC1026 TaxID=2745947 RepID=UPI00159BD61D|nr:DASH family cryptochrome [Spirosoma sp. KUDC1026]QKZ12112.1 DASH family cryptochrome [Spirosoma sp. KUDC1026]
MPKRILYWFRNDLRLHDNEGFARAVADADEVLPVFVFNPDWFVRLPDINVCKTGAYRTAFILESVADLQRSLKEKGVDLIIRMGNTARILAELAEEIGAEAVYASKEVTQEETDVESDLSKLLKPLNVDLEFFWMATLYHVRDLPFYVSRLPNQFTQFREQVEKSATVRELIPSPATIVSVPDIFAGELPTLETFSFVAAESQQDGRAAIRFKGGESVGLARLNAYLWEADLAKTYKETRNGMLGEDYSSKFSAWLSMGCLSPRQIYWELQRYESERVKNESTYWLVFELLWRDFFRFTALRYGTRLFKPSGIKYDLTKRGNRDLVLFQQWASGQTGIPFIDANMRELNETGYMSNRGRQNVASFLVKDLGVDWTWGATYFESLLVDYDPCSNWGNWNYIAGVGNDPRQDRYFNIYSQARRYDEQGSYVKYWLPELAAVPADKIHLVSNLSADEQTACNVMLGDTYPLPVINPNHWLTEEKHR